MYVCGDEWKGGSFNFFFVHLCVLRLTAKNMYYFCKNNPIIFLEVGWVRVLGGYKIYFLNVYEEVE